MTKSWFFFLILSGTQIVCSVYEIKIIYIVQEYENNTLRRPLIYSPNKRVENVFHYAKRRKNDYKNPNQLTSI